MSNSLDPDQARHFVGPDLDLNCLQRFSADDIADYELKKKFIFHQKSQLIRSDTRFDRRTALLTYLSRIANIYIVESIFQN